MMTEFEPRISGAGSDRSTILRHNHSPNKAFLVLIWRGTNRPNFNLSFIRSLSKCMTQGIAVTTRNCGLYNFRIIINSFSVLSKLATGIVILSVTEF